MDKTIASDTTVFMGKVQYFN